jgi:pyruvate carboxylase subunit B
MNALLIAPGLPGGMMGSLMSDLENNLKSLNKWKEKNNQPLITQDDLLIKLFDEVEEIWPKMGFPPLVTPYSQYVKNAALVNVMQMEKGKERWSLLDDNTWDMLLGKSGRLPGKLSEELEQLAKEQNREFYTGDPQDLQPDALDDFRKKMKEKGWDAGKDEEELLEYAMHPQQYEAYKSGKAKADFNLDLAQKKTPPMPEKLAETSGEKIASDSFQPKKMDITVNGEVYEVIVAYDNSTLEQAPPAIAASPETAKVDTSAMKQITAPLEGKIYLTKEAGEKAVSVGDVIREGDIVCYIEAMKVTNAVKSDQSGKVMEVLVKDGDEVFDDDVLIKLV